jgi:hypothetical protein
VVTREINRRDNAPVCGCQYPATAMQRVITAPAIRGETVART